MLVISYILKLKLLHQGTFNNKLTYNLSFLGKRDCSGQSCGVGVRILELEWEGILGRVGVDKNVVTLTMI
jgi:hypothetical protein